jgi:hypothetical protein
MRKIDCVVAYGFEYDKVIICDNDCRIGKNYLWKKFCLLCFVY